MRSLNDQLIHIIKFNAKKTSQKTKIFRQKFIVKTTIRFTSFMRTVRGQVPSNTRLHSDIKPILII